MDSQGSTQPTALPITWWALLSMKGKYNNLMWWFIGCEWSAEGDYTMKMKYQFTQEEFDDGE